MTRPAVSKSKPFFFKIHANDIRRWEDGSFQPLLPAVELVWFLLFEPDRVLCRDQVGYGPGPGLAPSGGQYGIRTRAAKRVDREFVRQPELVALLDLNATTDPGAPGKARNQVIVSTGSSRWTST